MTAALNTLLDLAERQRDAAQAAALQADTQLRRLQAQTDQLLAYRDDLRRRGPASGGRSASIELLRHHQAFMQRLDQALDQQRAQTEATAARSTTLRHELVALELRVASVRKLLERRGEAARQARERREQRHADDSAAQRHLQQAHTALPAAL